MSGFGFFFWRILLGPIMAPLWFVLGYVVSYLRTAFSGFWWFVFYASGPVLILPFLSHLLVVMMAFFDCYFDRRARLDDLIDTATLGGKPFVPRAAAPAPAPQGAPRNDCVYCTHEHGALPNGETGNWCLHFNEATLNTSRGYDIYARAGLNAYPNHSGRAQDGQTKYSGFVLDDRMRRNWHNRFG